MKDDQRVALTKRLLKEGLLRLMKKKQLEKIGVAELCKESGINRATFYRHYEQPKDILMEIGYELMDDLHFEEWNIVTVQDLAHYAEVMFSYIKENEELIKLLLLAHYDEGLTQLINAFCSGMYRIKFPFMDEGVDDKSMRLLTTYSIGGIYFLLKEWLLRGIEKTPQEISKLVLQLAETALQLLPGTE